VTVTSEVYSWGSNFHGQLGHHEDSIAKIPFKSLRVSCGHEYTIVLTKDYELMIAGKLPFKVNNRESLHSFEQLAKFCRGINVKQIESSKFTTILAQLPGEDKTELFIWGETPLGIMQEPMSLNQLINENQ